MSGDERRKPQKGEVWRRIQTPLLTVHIDDVNDVTVRYTVLTNDHGSPHRWEGRVASGVAHLLARDIGGIFVPGFLDDYEIDTKAAS